MSAPDTNTKKQTRRHKPALIGIGAALAFAAIVAVVMAVLPRLADGPTVTDPSETPVESLPANEGDAQ